MPHNEIFSETYLSKFANTDLLSGYTLKLAENAKKQVFFCSNLLLFNFFPLLNIIITVRNNLLDIPVYGVNNCVLNVIKYSKVSSL